MTRPALTLALLAPSPASPFAAGTTAAFRATPHSALLTTPHANPLATPQETIR